VIVKNKYISISQCSFTNDFRLKNVLMSNQLRQQKGQQLFRDCSKRRNSTIPNIFKVRPLMEGSVEKDPPDVHQYTLSTPTIFPSCPIKCLFPLSQLQLKKKHFTPPFLLRCNSKFFTSSCRGIFMSNIQNNKVWPNVVTMKKQTNHRPHLTSPG